MIIEGISMIIRDHKSKIIKSLIFTILLILFVKFYFIGVYKNFSKKSTTFTTTTENIDRMDYINIFLCFDPPFKPSVEEKFGQIDAYFLNTIGTFQPLNLSRWKLFQDLTYKVGKDFKVQSLLYESGTTMSFYDNKIEHIQSNLQEIATYRHGLCTLIKPQLQLSTDEQRLYVDITISPELKDQDWPKSINLWFTSDNGWNGFILDDWPYIKPKQFSIPLVKGVKPTWQFKLTQTDHHYMNGVDDFPDCFRKYIDKNSDNCKKCFPIIFNYLPDLPPCNTTEEIECISKATVLTRKGRYKCLNLQKQIEINADESYNGVANNNGTGAALKVYSMKDTKIIKEEILVVTIEEFIGSVGGSLGLFLGFSFLTLLYDIVDSLKL